MINQKQINAYLDPSRFLFVLAGRRGGKTFLVREKICKKISESPMKSEIFYIGPTNQQSKELIWNSVIDRFHSLKWNFRDLISRQCILLPGGRIFYVIGAEKIRRIRGHRLYHAFLDEVAYYDTSLVEVWNAVRPTLSDFQGGATLTTTPDGKGSEAYDFHLNIIGRPGWSYHHWKTLDNPWISREEIEAAKKELDEKSFKQEYEAEWQSFEGLAYYNFDENTHVKKQDEISVESPLHLCFDFNVNPTTLILSQPQGEMLSYRKEYSFKNSSTENTIEAFCQDFGDVKDRLQLKIRGDATGSSRSANTGKSDYYYVQQILTKYGFKYDYEVASRNPPIVDRLKIVNGWLKPVSGLHRIEIDPGCKELIRDLASQALNGRIPSDANNLGHKADAFGYDVYYQNLLHRKVKQATIEF